VRGTNKCLAVVLVLLHAHPVCAGPIQRSLAKLDATATTPSDPKGVGRTVGLREWGWILLGTGGALATVSVVVSDETASACEAGTPAAGCGWYRFGRVAPWVGVGAAGAGAVMILAGRGRQSPAITVHPRRVTVKMNYRF